MTVPKLTVTTLRPRLVEVKGMADRIITMREKLYGMLQNDLKTPGEWSHVKSQIGRSSNTDRGCSAGRC